MLYADPQLVFLDKSLFQIRVHSKSFSKEKFKLNKSQLVSDLDTLEKHFLLSRNMKTINRNSIKSFILERYNQYFMQALKRENKNCSFLFKSLLKKEIEYKRYKAFFNTIFGFTLFKLFGKGYRFLKNDFS
jgi:hypothetical protein